MHAELVYESALAENAMRHTSAHLEIVRDFRGPGDYHVEPQRSETGEGRADLVVLSNRVNLTAPIRQGMIDTYLQPQHSHVLWIDADVTRYDPNLPGRLLRASKDLGDAIVAPKVLLDVTGPDRFYDLAGFVQEGRWAHIREPYFDYPAGERYVHLDGVGCVYLIPADVYRMGAKHINIPGYTDHLAICRFAKGLGLDVVCDLEQEVYHADLQRYREGENAEESGA